jgi:hypothetical protein
MQKRLDFYKNLVTLGHMKTFNIRIRYSDTTFSSGLLVMDGTTVDQLLEDIFAQWNDGSGQECLIFSNNKTIRSLSVGDFVEVDGVWYRCEGMGWKVVEDTFVIRWFAEMANFASRRPMAASFADARYGCLQDRRKVEEKLGVYCF